MLHEIVSDQGLVVNVAERGAELNRIFDSREGVDYLWDANPEIWARHAPVLFPFVARLWEGKYEYKGIQYEMTAHGFAPTSDFCVDAKTSDSITLSISGVRDNWPFDTKFSVTYKVVGKTLDVTYKVDNRDSKTVYFAIGSHPGFNVPLEKGLSFEDYYAYFPESGDVNKVVFSERVFDSGERVKVELPDHKIALRHDLFDNDAIVMDNTGSVVVIRSDKGRHGVEVRYPNTHWCALWHKVKMEAPFVCVEPWSSLPARDGQLVDVETKGDLIALAPGASYEQKLIITVF